MSFDVVVEVLGLVELAALAAVLVALVRPRRPIVLALRPAPERARVEAEAVAEPGVA
jgi:hypothetical protein